MDWIDPRKELPTRNVEVLIKGYGAWLSCNYFVSMWSGFDGSGQFLGTGCDPNCGIFTFESWAYLEDKIRTKKDNAKLAEEYSLRSYYIDPISGVHETPSQDNVNTFHNNLNGCTNNSFDEYRP